MATKFSSDELLVIRWMAMQGSCAVEIARALKRDPTSVRVKCKSLNIPLRRERSSERFGTEEVQTIRALARQGWSANSIAKQLNRQPGAIRSKACAAGISLRPPRGNDTLEFRIDKQTKHYFQRAAEQRGCTGIGELLRRLLSQISECDLVTSLMVGTYKPPRPEPKRKVVAPEPAISSPVAETPPAPPPEIQIVLEPPSFNLQVQSGTPELNGFMHGPAY